MSIEINLSGKNIAVTGAGRGLGKAVALKLAQAGANIWLGDINEDNLKTAAKDVELLGGKAGYQLVDVGDLEQVTAWMKGASAFGGGKLDVMVNVAGIVDTAGILETNVAKCERVFRVNTIGTVNTVRAALEEMIPHNSGKIVCVTSVAGRQGSDGTEIYGASKAAAIHLTQSAAMRAAPFHINVNGVAPGIIRTEMWEQILTEATQGQNDLRDPVFEACVNGNIAFKRPQTAEDIANAVLFLASPLANEITGQTINVDGGWMLN